MTAAMVINIFCLVAFLALFLATVAARKALDEAEAALARLEGFDGCPADADDLFDADLRGDT